MNHLAGKRVALIGGAGFIGHHLALELVEKGAKVSIVDGLSVNNLTRFADTSVPVHNRDLYTKMLYERLDCLRKANVPVFVQDARDYSALTRILNELSPQIVVQLAAVAHAGRSNKDPYTTFDHSLRTLENALDWSRIGIEQFIYFSSSMVYGNFSGGEVTEDCPLDSLGIYGALKVAGERMVIAYNQVFDMPYTILRPSALYGPRCVSRRVGQIFIENAFDGLPLEVVGDETLDFTYIDDLVQGICLCMGNPKAYGETFNMTYGSGRSVRDVAEIISKHCPGVEVKVAERDKLTPKRGTLRVDKAREILGYEPKNPIEVGFPKYLEWYRSFRAESTKSPVAAG